MFDIQIPADEEILALAAAMELEIDLATYINAYGN